MLNGIDPIIIFNFKKKITAPVFGPQPEITVIDKLSAMIDLPLIPIYLSEKLTGIYIDSEDKNIEIDTQFETLPSGDTPPVNQKGITSNIRINMVASRDSIGVAIFGALADLVFPRVTSKEYSITYLHGAVTIFQGWMHSFSINQNANNDLYNITLELVKNPPAAKMVYEVGRSVLGAVKPS